MEVTPQEQRTMASKGGEYEVETPKQGESDGDFSSDLDSAGEGDQPHGEPHGDLVSEELMAKWGAAQEYLAQQGLDAETTAKLLGLPQMVKQQVHLHRKRRSEAREARKQRRADRRKREHESKMAAKQLRQADQRTEDELNSTIPTDPNHTQSSTVSPDSVIDFTSSRVVPVTEVISLLRAERKAERESLELQFRRSAIPARPQMYDGNSSGAVFLEDFEYYIENGSSCRPKPSDFTNSFAAFLADRAKIWYRRLEMPQQHDWSTLKELFQKRFVEHFSDQAESAYKQRVQGHTESVESYSADMDRLLALAKISKPEMLNIFIANLAPALKTYVKSKNPASIGEAEKYARDKEADIRASLHYGQDRFGSSNINISTSDSKNEDEGIYQRVLERIQALSTQNSTPSPSKSVQEREDALFQRFLQQHSQQKGKGRQPKHTVAAVSMESQPQPTKSKKKKGKSANGQQAAVQSSPAPPTAPVFQQMPFPFYPGPVMHPGQQYFSYPPPNHGQQTSSPAPAQMVPVPVQAPVSQNQGN